MIDNRYKLWIDDIRIAPDGYEWLKSVNESIAFIKFHYDEIEEINLDHDAGDFYSDGGDYIRILDWLEMVYGEDLIPTIKIHSMNPVGVTNMKRIINRNGWKY